jgi:hypothetical protein
MATVKQREAIDAAWLEFQARPRKAPVPPPESVLASVPYEAPEPIETRKIDVAEQTGESLELTLAYERHLAAHPDGQVIPGSSKESDALARIEQLRAEEQEREARKGVARSGQLVSLRPRGGRLVEVWRTGRGRFVEVE